MLNSPLVKGRIVEKLNQGTGLDWEIAAATWSPTGGVVLKQVSAPMGDGGVSVEKIRVRIALSEVFQKHRGVEELILIHPKLDLSVRKLTKGQVSPDDWEKIPAVQPSPAGHAPPDTAVAGNPGPAPSDPQNQPASAQPSDTGAAGAGQVNQAPKDPDWLAGKVIWLKMRDGEVIIRDGERVLAESKQIHMNVPLGGDEVGKVSWADANLLGQRAIASGELKVASQGRILKFDGENVLAAGVKFTPRILLKPSGGRIMFQCDVIAQDQNVELKSEVDGVTTAFSVNHFSGRLLVGGSLYEPKTWAGLGAWKAQNASLLEGHRGGKIAFDELGVEMVVRNGVLWVPTAVARGRDLTLMGNGVLVTNGYGFGILRVVASAEKQDWLQRVYAGAGIAEANGQYDLMSALETRDRFFTDISFDGSLFNPEVRIGENGQWLSLRRVLDRMHQFIRAEKKEDEIDGEVTKDPQ